MVEQAKGRPARKETVKKERRRRTAMGIERNQRLHIDPRAKDPNFEYRWANDTPGRIDALTKSDDYDIVTEEMLDGHKGTEGEGTPVKRAVGTGANGEWVYAYLVRKPKEFYQEDKAKEQEALADAETGMKEGPVRSAEGLGTRDHAYVPEGHQNVIE